MSVRLLGVSGSARKESLNTKLLKHAGDVLIELGAEFTLLDINHYDLPIYNGDDEARTGIPKNVKELKQIMKSHDGFVFCSPEHNSTYSALLKNYIDWCSRGEPGEGPLAAFKGKSGVLFSASPGQLGGLRGLFALRSLLMNIGVYVIPDQFSLGDADEAFDEDGALKSEEHKAKVRGICGGFLGFTGKLVGKGG